MSCWSGRQIWGFLWIFFKKGISSSNCSEWTRFTSCFDADKFSLSCLFFFNIEPMDSFLICSSYLSLLSHKFYFIILSIPRFGRIPWVRTMHQMIKMARRKASRLKMASGLPTLHALSKHCNSCFWLPIALVFFYWSWMTFWRESYWRHKPTYATHTSWPSNVHMSII